VLRPRVCAVRHCVAVPVACYQVEDETLAAFARSMGVESFRLFQDRLEDARNKRLAELKKLTSRRIALNEHVSARAAITTCGAVGLLMLRIRVRVLPAVLDAQLSFDRKRLEDAGKELKEMAKQLKVR
jgi:hypothetical protein